MKNIKLLVIGLAAVLGFSACSESWLDNELTGGSLSQEEYDKTPATIEGSVRGLYSFLYAAVSSEHHTFGQKSIDIATDFMSGDMSMSADAYGWFVSDAQLMGSSASGSRNAYIWSYYYQIIMNANFVIRSLDSKESLTLEEKDYYAQVLTMRAYCYFNLLHLYTPGRTDGNEGFMGGIGMDYRAVPIYNETMFNDKGLPKEQDLSTKRELIDAVRNDLTAALSYFDAVAQDTVLVRPSKLYVNADIARMYSAYTYMIEEKWDSAYAEAERVINSTDNGYAILPYDDVTTTGFTNVDNPSWMWGLDVTIDNTSALASFWGHMDIYTYSYAQAGARKIIDDLLYKSIPDYDARKKWFDASKLNPDWKFYDLNRGTGNNVDRRWLNDIVYMRIEEAYLVAAEAAWRAGKEAEAKSRLKDLVSERYRAVKEGDPDPVAAIDALSSDLLGAEIEYNWRIELWGEGRSLMTFKRFGGAHTTGSRRAFLKNENLQATDTRLLFRLPSGEQSSNMAITYPK